MSQDNNFKIAFRKVRALKNPKKNCKEYIDAINMAQNWNDIKHLVSYIEPFGRTEYSALLSKTQALVQINPQGANVITIGNILPWIREGTRLHKFLIELAKKADRR